MTDDFREIWRVHTRKSAGVLGGLITGAVLGLAGLPDDEYQATSWAINVATLVVPCLTIYWVSYRLWLRRSLDMFPGIDTTLCQLTVGEAALTTQDEMLTQIQRYDRFRSYRTSATLLILYRTNNAVVPVPLDRTPEDLRRKLLQRLTEAGVTEEQRLPVIRELATFAIPALVMFAILGLAQGA